jgi:hypothetical protein
VSQFAAGCAICGADLVAARAAKGGDTIGDRVAALEPDFLRDAETRKEIVLVAIIALIVLGFPIAGLPIAAWIAYQRHREGDNAMRNIMICLAVFSILEMGVFRYQYGLLDYWIN